MGTGRGMEGGRRYSTLEMGGARIAVVSAPCVGTVLSSLTEAEAGVAALAARGLTNAEIAEVRGTSRHTVANQVRTILSKLGVRARREIAHALVSRGP